MLCVCVCLFCFGRQQLAAEAAEDGEFEGEDAVENDMDDNELREYADGLLAAGEPGSACDAYSTLLERRRSAGMDDTSLENAGALRVLFHSSARRSLAFARLRPLHVVARTIFFF